MSNQVQALTIALFGAYAGGYTAELEASIEASGVQAVANSLTGLQGPLLGLDLSSDATWIDVFLGNVGIDSTNAAYAAAKAWAEGELAAGATRGDVVAAAVTYLLGDSVSDEFQAVADAFVADVEAGVEYSEGDGAEVFGVGDLREAAGNAATATGFNLTAALAELLAAQEAVDDFVTAWGEANDVDPVDATDITDAVTDAENAINALYADYVPAESAAQKAAALALIEADLAAALKTAQDDLNTDTTNVSAVTGLKSAIDRFVTAYNASEDAIEAADLADIAEDDALAAAGVYYDLTGGSDDSYDYLTYDAVADRYTNEATAADLVADGLTAGEAAAYLIKLTALADAYNEQQAASEAAADAYDLAQTRLDTITALGYEADGTVTTGSTADTELAAGIAADYALAAGAVTDAQDDIDELAELVADLEAAQADADELEALQDAVTEIEDAFAAEDYAVVTADGTAISTLDEDGTDVINLSQLEGGDTQDIDNFGLTDSDILYFGSQSYELVQLASDEDITDAVGDASAYEIFWEETAGGDLILYVETAAFGGNLGDDQELITVTLTGFAASDIGSFNGTILVA